MNEKICKNCRYIEKVVTASECYFECDNIKYDYQYTYENNSCDYFIDNNPYRMKEGKKNENQ